MSQESELEIIAALLTGSEQTYLIEDRIRAEHFTVGAFKAIYDQAMSIHRSGAKLSPTLVIDRLKDINEELIETIFHACEYCDEINLSHYIDYTIEDWRKRVMNLEVNKLANEIHQLAADDALKLVQDTAAKAESLVENLSTSPTWKEQSLELLKMVDMMTSKEDSIAGQRFGLRPLEELIGGFRDGGLITVGGNSGMGKSTFGWQAFLAMAFLNPDRFYLGLTLEMPSYEVQARFNAQTARVNISHLLNGNLNKEELDRFHVGLTKTAALKNTHVEQMNSPKPANMLALIRKHARQKHMGAIVIDAPYLCDINEDRMRHEISNITRSLKSMAKEYKCPIIIMAQVNKQVLKREKKRPILSDLTESAGYENDSDIVMFVYRHSIAIGDPKHKFAGAAELIVRKNRQGKTGTVTVAAPLQYCKFEEFAIGENPYLEGND